MTAILCGLANEAVRSTRHVLPRRSSIQIAPTAVHPFRQGLQATGPFDAVNQNSKSRGWRAPAGAAHESHLVGGAAPSNLWEQVTRLQLAEILIAADIHGACDSGIR